MAGLLLWAIVEPGLAAPVDAAVLRALSSRDPVPCAQVEALSAAPREALEAIVDTVTAPPWAPMRAAQCLIDGHAAAAQARFERWVEDPALKGLGRLVLGQLDRLPVEVAVAVSRKALAGSDPALARERIAAAQAPELRALVGAP